MIQDDETQSPRRHTAFIAIALAAVFAVLLAWQVQRGDDERNEIDEMQRRQLEQILDD